MKWAKVCMNMCELFGAHLSLQEDLRKLQLAYVEEHEQQIRPACSKVHVRLVYLLGLRLHKLRQKENMGQQRVLHQQLESQLCKLICFISFQITSPLEVEWPRYRTPHFDAEPASKQVHTPATNTCG